MYLKAKCVFLFIKKAHNQITFASFGKQTFYCLIYSNKNTDSYIPCLLQISIKVQKGHTKVSVELI